MRKFIYTMISLIPFSLTVNAQVGIETENVSDKAILDFPDKADGGILLPYVSSADANSVPGTIIYNVNADKGTVQYKDINNNWVDLSITPEDKTFIDSHDTNTYAELDADGVVISNTNEEPTATGVLVLESNDRALALPKVDGVENIQSPKPGMICYDISRRALAIFNGEKWILRN